MLVLGLITIALTGFFVGMSSGLLGIGGNIIAIPTLLFILKNILGFSAADAMHIVLATCFIVMIFTAGSSASAHYKQQNICWDAYKKIAPYMVLGVVIGAICASVIHGKILEKIFGVFLLLIAIEMAVSRENKEHIGEIRPIPNVIYMTLGTLIGFKSGLLGIGGGVILIPFLLFLNYPANLVVGTTSLCSFTVALVGGITFFITGSMKNLHLPDTIGFIYWPAILLMAPTTFIGAKVGAHLTKKIPHTYLKRILTLLVAVLSIAMIF